MEKEKEKKKRFLICTRYHTTLHSGAPTVKFVRSSTALDMLWLSMKIPTSCSVVSASAYVVVSLSS